MNNAERYQAAYAAGRADVNDGRDYNAPAGAFERRAYDGGWDRAVAGTNRGESDE